jgi:aminopeptidase-like protein
MLAGSTLRAMELLMLLETLRSPAASEAAAHEAFELMRAMYPLCRSITGDGVRRTLDLIETWAPLQRHEVPSGTAVFDWDVPQEWNIRDAYVADDDGRRLIDFRAHTLHVVSYSTPVRARMSRAELEPHLHSLPEQPDRIPYRTSYYRENWGFCLRQADRERLGDGPFEVVIDSTLAPGHLSYAECVVPGSSSDEAMVYTHVCHPSLANDNLSGIVVAAALARALRAEKPRLTWRFVFAPGTIGSLTWLSRNEAGLSRLQAGLVIGLLGDAGALTYKPSRRGGTLVDRAAALVMPQVGGREVEFEPYGYDERQFCSPGFDLPVGRLTRTPNGAFPEYHTSADDLGFVQPAALAASIQALAAMIGAIDANRRWRNLSPKGEPRLGKRGLYSAVGGRGPGDHEQGLLWLLNQSDGQHDLIDIARRSRLPIETLARGAEALAAVGLLAEVAHPNHELQGIPT